MSDLMLNALRRLLVDDYHGLKERLARRLGSIDFASEVLHEAWLRLGRIQADRSAAAVLNPEAYLYRIAVNLATDRKRAESSRLRTLELESLYRRVLDELDPARILEARSQVEVLARAINQLPARRRAVFIAARLEELPYKVIAERLGVTVRVVDREMKLALDHLSDVINKNLTGGGGSDASGTFES